jgi:hypothetical protein
MTRRTPIADQVQELLATGAPADVVVAAIRAMETGERHLHKSRQLALIDTAKRATRISSTWLPSSYDVAFAQERGMTNAQIEIEAEKFLNYWTAKSGRNATKLDWEATWRNWVLNALERLHAGRNYSSARRPPVGADAIMAGLDRATAKFRTKRDAAGSTDEKISRNPDAPRLLGFDRGGA